MANTKEKNTILEDLADQAIQKSDHAQETGKMKDQINQHRRYRKKCTIGKSVDKKTIGRGKVKEYSKFEVAIENLLREIKGKDLDKRNLTTYSDILLKLISTWKDKALGLEKRGKIDAKYLRDAKGKLLIASPWTILAIEGFFRKEFSKIYCERTGKDETEITREDIRAQTSSIFSAIIKTFVELGLAKKVPAIIGSVKTYYVYEKTYRFSMEQLHHLFIEGKKLCKRKKFGEFGDRQFVAEKKVEEYGEGKLEKFTRIEIPTETNTGNITRKSIEIKPDGTIVIETFYR